MKFCKNNKNKKYKGDENTPLRNGFSASGENIGTIKPGKNKIKYIVINTKNGKRWKKYITNKSPRGAGMSSVAGRIDKIIRELRLGARLTTEDIKKIQETSNSQSEEINMLYAVANSNFYEHPELLLPETPKSVVFWANKYHEYLSNEWQYWTLVRETGYYKPLIVSLIHNEIDQLVFNKLSEKEIIEIVKREREKLFPNAPPPQKYVIEAKPGYY